MLFILYRGAGILTQMCPIFVLILEEFSDQLPLVTIGFPLSMKLVYWA
jgi:hypothetical protein